MARKTFLTFHYANDCWRVQTIKGIGAIEEQPLLSSNAWEEVEKGGDAAIKKWIDGEMSGKSCDIVLIGSATAGRKWVNYEIKKAWDDGKGVLGIHIHKLKDSNGNQSTMGTNPFSTFNVGQKPLTNWAKTYNPPYSDSKDVYDYIKSNIEDWIEEAIRLRKQAG